MTPSPTATSTTTPTATQDPNCNRAAFVNDVTVPDNSVLNAGQAFVKTWRIRNAGTCTWSTSYKLVFTGGERMGAPDSVALPKAVAPDESVDISVNLIAPADEGAYQGFWQLQAEAGELFGVGSAADRPVWVKISVIVPSPVTQTAQAVITPSETVPAPTAEAAAAYDFVENVCQAEWVNRDGRLPCPGTDGDLAGFVLVVDQPTLEDGTTTASSALLTFPQPSEGGLIQATYPPFLVQPGDRFKAIVGCENGAPACSILYRLSYKDPAGQVSDLWALGEFYDGKVYQLDIDLASLAGQEVQFILNVTSLGSVVEDRALWVAPRIVRVPLPTPTVTPTALPSPSPVPTETLTATPAPTATPIPAQPTPPPGNLLDRFIEWLRSLFEGIFGK